MILMLVLWVGWWLFVSLSLFAFVCWLYFEVNGL